MLLFLSNLLALVAAGVVTFATFIAPTAERVQRGRHRPGLLIATVAVVITVPLAGNTAATYTMDKYSADVHHATEEWLASTPSATVTKVDFTSLTDVHIYVRQPGDLPARSRLLQQLQGVLPDGVTVHLDDSIGSDTTVGTIGSDT